VIWSSTNPQIPHWIETTTNALAFFDADWTEERVKAWLHRNEVHWGRHLSPPPVWDSPGLSRKDSRKPLKSASLPSPRHDRPPPQSTGPAFDPRVPTARKVVEDLVDEFYNSISLWREHITAEDAHPEVTTFITFQLSKWFSGLRFGLGGYLFEAHKDTIMMLMDEDQKKRRRVRLLEAARARREEKQAQRTWHRRQESPPRNFGRLRGAALAEINSTRMTKIKI
jgi:hypothetical protein